MSILDFEDFVGFAESWEYHGIEFDGIGGEYIEGGILIPRN